MIAEIKKLPIQKEIEWAYIEEHFKEYLPDYVQLRYVDYRDSLEYCMKQVADGIKKNDFLDLENYVLECYNDQEWESVTDYWDKFKENVLEELEQMYEVLDEPYGEYGDFIAAVRDFVENDDCCFEGFRDYLWEHDESGDICKELMDKTDEPGMFYDLNEWFDESWNWSDKEFGKNIKRVCKALHLDFTNKKNRDMACSLLANASGGGNLRIYFNCPIWELVSGDENGYKYGTDGKYDYKSIKFKGKFMIGIINMWEGSGMVEDDVELDVSFQFNRENLRISEQETYSYENVFGAYSNYQCDTPIFSFQEPESDVKVNTDLVYHQDREDKYQEAWRHGKCTCGDRNISRHRHIKSNGYGDLICEDCGTTWYVD